jgi:hypothetical protein
VRACHARGMEITRVRATRLATAVVAAFLLLIAAGCGTIEAFLDLQERLEDQGFSDVDVNVDTGGGDTLRIDATQPPGDTPEEGAEKAAETAWTTFPRRFEQMQLNIGGTSFNLNRQQLEQQFGPREARLDEKELEDDVKNIGVGVLIALGVGAVLCLGLIILIIVLVMRSRKKKRAAQAQQWGGPGGPGGYPQQPYGQPQQPYGQPPQQQQQWGPPPGQQQPPPPPPPGENPPGWG